MNEPVEHIVVGTAGHIDHGKSTLVQAITGTDPDRWEEEKRRGITIDLGFAHATIGGSAFSFVDVPGHERFVHNMLAGATGIDLVLLVVAADESVMPQTREHLSICSLLGLKTGVVALSRVDLAEDGLADLAEEEVREMLAGTFLEEAPIVQVSGLTGEGLDDLREALAQAAQQLRVHSTGPGQEKTWPRLGVDRVFAAKGFGSVVTGTLQGGSLAVGERLVAIPGGIEGRIRGLQVHGQGVDSVGSHCRVAVNIQGVDREQLCRGMVLVPPGREATTLFFDADVRLIEDATAPLEEGMRVRIHHGTAEVMARLRLPDPGVLEPGGRGAVQFRLEAPLALLPGDRFIIRRYSPITTLGGGQVADLDPPRWRRTDLRWQERTPRLAMASPLERVKIVSVEAGVEGVSLDKRAVRLGVEPARAREALPGGLSLLGGDRVVSREGLNQLRAELKKTLSAFHRAHPLEPGPAPERVRAQLVPDWPLALFREFLERSREKGGLVVDRDVVRLASHKSAPEGQELVQLERMIEVLDEAGLLAMPLWELQEKSGVGDQAADLLTFASRTGQAVRVKDGIWVSGKAWTGMVDRLREEAQAGRNSLGVPTFKELFGLSRKYAIPLLERLDDAGITRRAGNERRLRL